MTSEPAGSSDDTLTIQVTNASNQVVAVVHQITTAQAATYASYALVTVPLTATHTVAGYRIRFGAMEDAGNATTFPIDDVSAQ